MKRLSTSVLAVALALAVSAGVAAADPARRTATLSGNDDSKTGRAVLRIDPPGGRICFRITFEGVHRPNFGGIYRGSHSGAALEVTLFNGDRGPRSSPVEGCARDLARPIVREIKRHPGRFWVKINHYSFAGSLLTGKIERA